MKYIKLLLCLCVATLLSCSNFEVENLKSESRQVSFSGTIGVLKTRVTDNSWNSGDEIGIYALAAGKTLSASTVFDKKSNIRYVADANGTFSPISTHISFPEKGNLDFVVYYPYQKTINNFLFNINVTNQSPVANIDLLFSNNARGENISKPYVNLVFNHVLSKLVMHVKGGVNVNSLFGLKASINDVIIDGDFNLASGQVIIGSTKSHITPIISTTPDNEWITISAIMLPGQNLESVRVIFKLGDENYVWIPNPQELVSTTEYTYKLKLVIDDFGVPTVEPLQVSATIDDWIIGNTEDEQIVLTPTSPEESDGTKQNPYTVKQALSSQDDRSGVWVKSFIVGTTNNGSVFTPQFSLDNPSSTNIVLADNKDETDETAVIPVQLTSGGAARNELNLSVNPNMYKAEVLLKGDLTKYFGVIGLKNVKEYELITSEE